MLPPFPQNLPFQKTFPYIESPLRVFPERNAFDRL